MRPATVGFPLLDPPDSAPRRRQLIILRRRMASLLWLIYEVGMGLALLIVGFVGYLTVGRRT